MRASGRHSKSQTSAYRTTRSTELLLTWRGWRVPYGTGPGARRWCTSHPLQRPASDQYDPGRHDVEIRAGKGSYSLQTGCRSMIVDPMVFGGRECHLVP